MLQVKIGLIVGLAAPLFLLTGCFDSDNKTVPLAENDNNRIRLAMLLPPRSGLTPLSDVRSNYLDGVRPKHYLI